MFGYDSELVFGEMLEEMFGEDVELDEEEFDVDEEGEEVGDGFYDDVLQPDVKEVEGISPIFSEKEERLGVPWALICKQSRLLHES